MANGEVKINGFKTTMLFSTGTGSNFISENEVKNILPNYMDYLKPSDAKLYWNIQGENIGEVYLNIKYEKKKVNQVPFCVVRGASARMPVFNKFGCPILVIGGMQLVLDEFKLFPELSKIGTRTKDGLFTQLSPVSEQEIEINRWKQEGTEKKPDQSRKTQEKAEMPGLKAAEIRAAATERGWEEITGKKKKSHLLKFEWKGNGNSDKWALIINSQIGWIQSFKGGSQMTESVTNMSAAIHILDKPRNFNKKPPNTDYRPAKEELKVEVLPDLPNLPLTLGLDSMKFLLNDDEPKGNTRSSTEARMNPSSSTEYKVNSSDDYVDICWSCSKTKLEVKLHTCTGCRRAKYCSRKCIEQDWPVHGNWCIKQQKKREAKI